MFISKNLFAAACCGGGFAAPSIIAGDEKAVLTTSYSITEVTVDNVDSNGVWRKWDQHQKVQSFRLEGAHTFAELWQAGFAIPVVQRTRMESNYSGLGDAATMVGYEYLPDWDYNPIRPKGIGFLQITFPTGKSRADSENGGLDSRGNGFWALGIGTLLTKTFRQWDFFSSFEVHRSFGKSISTSQISGTLKPGLGGNLGFGAGLNFKDYRAGSSITWTYEDPIDIETDQSTISGAAERYATAALSASYMASEDWAGTLSYTDQTLFGNPVNTSLGRGFAIQIQRRWGR